MIKGISKIIELLGGKPLSSGIFVAIIIWMIGYLICFGLGGIALWRMGRRGGYKKSWLAWIPGAQIYCEAQFSDRPHTAKRIQCCLWWFWVAVMGCIACAVWIAAALAGVADIATNLLKVILIGLIIAGLILYFLIRADELTCLRKVLNNDTLWFVSVVGSIFCIPLQRIFLFSLTQEEDEEFEDEDEEDEDE